MIFSSSIHLLLKFMISYFFSEEDYYIVYIFIFHSFFFHILAIFKSVENDCKTLRHMPHSVILGDYGRFIYNFLRILHTDFHRGHTSLQPHQQ